jgi:membrane protein
MISPFTTAREAGRGFTRDQCLLMAAGLSFFAFLALLPSIMIAISIFGYVIRGSEAATARIVELIQRILPVGVGQVEGAIEKVVSERGLIGITGIVFLIWTGSSVFTQLRHALDVIFKIEPRKGFWYRKIVAMLVVLGLTVLLAGLGLLLPAWRFIENYNARVLGSRLAEVPLLPAAVDWGGSIVLSWMIFGMIYRLLPRRSVAWSEAIVAGGVCGIPWEMARRVFGWYAASAASRSALYGSLSSLVLLLSWIYATFFLFLYGVEVIRAMRLLKERAAGTSPVPQRLRPRRKATEDSRPHPDRESRARATGTDTRPAPPP